jgi:hypothetical protein
VCGPVLTANGPLITQAIRMRNGTSVVGSIKRSPTCQIAPDRTPGLHDEGTGIGPIYAGIEHAADFPDKAQEILIRFLSEG